MIRKNGMHGFVSTPIDEGCAACPFTKDSAIHTPVKFFLEEASEAILEPDGRLFLIIESPVEFEKNITDAVDKLGRHIVIGEELFEVTGILYHASSSPVHVGERVEVGVRHVPLPRV